MGARCNILYDTIACSPEEWEGYDAKIKWGAEEIAGHTFYGYRYPKRGHYNRCSIFRCDFTANLVRIFDQRRESGSPFRVRFQSSLGHPLGCEEVMIMIDFLRHKFKTEMLIKQVDLAVDLHGVKYETIRGMLRVGNRKPRFEDGSFYFGSSRHPAQTVLYDKAAEQKTEGDWVRIELKLKIPVLRERRITVVEDIFNHDWTDIYPHCFTLYRATAELIRMYNPRKRTLWKMKELLKKRSMVNFYRDYVEDERIIAKLIKKALKWKWCPR